MPWRGGRTLGSASGHPPPAPRCAWPTTPPRKQEEEKKAYGSVARSAVRTAPIQSRRSPPGGAIRTAPIAWGPPHPAAAMYKYAETGIGPRVLSRSISGARADQTAGSESGGPVPAPAWLRGCLPPPSTPPPFSATTTTLPRCASAAAAEEEKNKGKKSPPPCCCRLFGLDRGPPLPSKSAGSRPVSSPTPPAGSCCSTAALLGSSIQLAPAPDI